MADDIAGYRQGLEDLLKTRDEETWTDLELDAAIRLALAEVSQRLPRALSGDVVMATASREVSLAELSDCLWVEEVWWPYEEGDYPPHLAPFEMRGGNAYLYTLAMPAVGETVHVLYAGRHTIAGLDNATVTTLPADWRGVLTLGAAGFAGVAKAAAMAREYAWPQGATEDMTRWSQLMMKFFDARLNALRQPAAQAWVSWG